MKDPVEQVNNFLTIGGVVLLAIGAEFENALLINIALVALGGGLLAGGTKTFLRPELRFWMEGLSIGERNAAMGEYLWALAFVLGGYSLLLFGGIRLLGWEQAAENFLRARPGAALFVGGAIAAAAGGRMALQPFTVKSWSGVMELILTLPMRVIGLAIGLAGLAAIFLGVFEMVIPAAFDRWWTGVLESLPRPPEIY
jgi:hypothetical protein